MYCKNCGKKLNDGDVHCINCGCKVEQTGSIQYVKEVTEFDGEEKTGTGVICAIFLGILGLIIGFMYPASTIERKTFLRGWGIAYAISRVILVLIGFVGCCVMFDYYIDYFERFARAIL